MAYVFKLEVQVALDIFNPDGAMNDRPLTESTESLNDFWAKLLWLGRSIQVEELPEILHPTRYGTALSREERKGRFTLRL